MIIDSHVHVCGPPYSEDTLSFHVYDGRVIPISKTRTKCSPDSLLRDMDECNIDIAFISVLEGWTTNEELSKIIKAHPKRFVGYAWVKNPKNGKESVKELDHAVRVLGHKGLKLHSGLQGFSPSDPEILPLIRHSASLDVPIYIHTFPWPPGTFQMNLPEHIDTLKSRVPEAKIIIGHMGGQRFLDLLTLVGLPDVYADTSCTLNIITEMWGIEFASKFIRMLGVDNVLFGSDWYGDISRVTSWNLEIFEKMSLTKEEKDKILGENARKLMNLT